MDHTNLEKPKSRENSIGLNIPDIEFDNFDEIDFKPLNKGLGFHNEQRPMPKPVSKPIERRKTNPIQSGFSTQHDALANFYNSNSDLKLKTKPSEELELEGKGPYKVTTYQGSIPVYISFFSWVVDIVILNAVVLVVAIGFVVFSGLNFVELKSTITSNDLILFGSIIYALFYLTYFSVLDIVATPGKILFGIRHVDSKNQSISFFTSLTYSLITLVCFLTGLFLFFLGFQDKLTNTKIIQR